MRRASKPVVPDTVDPVELRANAIAQLLSADMREDLLAILRDIFEPNTLAERLAYSPDEAAELLGISRELVHDLLRTGQLGSVKAGRRRLIAKHHLEAFLATELLRKAACQHLYIGTSNLGSTATDRSYYNALMLMRISVHLAKPLMEQRLTQRRER
jgi:excisionase family DNA binding protein